LTLVALLQRLPRALVEPFARRYVAGSTFEDALRVAGELASRGFLTTFDVLGEEHRTEEPVRALVEEYRRILREEREPDATLSVRMTALGFRVSEELCRRNLLALAREAAARGRGLTIDMEDSSTTTATLDAYRTLRSEGLDDVGIVLQAYLRRTLADVEALAALAPRVRVVKGIWVEPPELLVADVEANYVRVLEGLLAAGCYVEIATHDERLVERALELVGGTDGHEFQLLLGVKPALGERLVAAGHRVRIYVPYGADWYGYCMRRLQENPAVARAVAGDVLARFFRRRR
jgi:proline dehydrogenase